MSLFSTTSLIISISSIVFGLSLYSGNRKSNVNRLWFLFSVCVSLWSLGLFGVTWSSSADSALRWQYLLDVSGIFVPVVYFSFASELVGRKNFPWRLFSFLLAGALSIFSFSTLFKAGMVFQYNFYWINPGPLYIVFPAFFLAYVFVCLIIYLNAYLNSKDKLFRGQIVSMLLASIVGFGGGVTNFLPQILHLYPYGNFFVLFYLFFMSYGVLKFKFISKKIISAQLLVSATVVVFLFSFLRTLTPENGPFSPTESSISLVLLILVTIFGFLIVKGVYREVEQREKIEKLATDLEAANKRLTELDRQKSEFVSFASHQLRAPLTAMKGYESLLLEGDMGELTGQAKDGITRIYESTKTLVNIVEDYLNVSRIELGTMKYTFETIDLSAMVSDVIGELRPNIEGKGLKFNFSAEDHGTDYRVTADRDKLKQVIANLIDNSVKYTPSGSVNVSLSRDRVKNRIIFEIKDTGIGIAPEVIPHLFQKFSRADGASKVNIKGTGLGLYVAKQIVEAHHASIRAESDGEGKGSRFVVEFEPFGKA